MQSKENFIGRCIFLALKALGNTYPNPLVGAVVVNNSAIIGEGYHHKAGQAHAEVNAVKNLDAALLQSSALYVSLEPCAHFGKTPPCANMIVDKKIPEVIIGSTDSHDKVFGKGIKLLQSHQISVVTNVLKEDCRRLNKRFFTYHEKKRPYVILKWAASEDGFIDKNFEPVAISNSLVNQFMHQRRSEEQAIFVGTNTVLRDNPSLSVRKINGKNPVRIILDLNLKISKSSKVFNADAEVIVLNLIKDEVSGHINYKKIAGINIVEEILNVLYNAEIQSVIIEGGALVLQQFIDSGFWDEAVIIKNPELYLINGTKQPIFNFEPNKKITMRNNVIYFYKNT